MSAITTADYLAQHGEALEAAIGAAVQKAIASRAADPVAYVARELSRPAKPVRALLIIDVQNDFISGSLSLKACPAGDDGARVVPVINQLRDAVEWDVVVISLDSHPHEHVSFHETVTAGASPSPVHPTNPTPVASIELFEEAVLTAPDGVSPMVQDLWPRHCVAGTPGAECHPDLVRRASDFVVHKGTNAAIDSYSAFFDNSKWKQTPLLDELKRRGVTHVYVCGLAYDVCVTFTAIDAAQAGFATVVVDDACACVSHEQLAERKAAMHHAGVTIAGSAELAAALAPAPPTSKWMSLRRQWRKAAAGA